MRDAESPGRGDELTGIPECQAGREGEQVAEEQRGAGNPRRAARRQAPTPIASSGTRDGACPDSISRNW